MLRQPIKRAGTITIVSFGLSQSIRFGANLITARLLSPEMFGIMALISVLMQGIVMCSDLGLHAYIIRNKEYRNKHIQNVVWTIQFVRGWGIFALTLLLGLFLHIWQTNLNQQMGMYSFEQLPIILALVGSTALFAGSKTLAPAILSRELNRGRLELAELLSQLIGASVMIIWAWNCPSIWALVSAGIVTSIISLILNYLVFDFRHRLVWDKVVTKEIFNFGKWIFIATFMTYVSQQGDKLYLSTILTASMLGVYSIAFMMSGLITSLIEQFTNKIWLPLFSSNSSNRTELKAIFYRARQNQDVMVSVLALCLGYAAPFAIDFLYDDRYQDASWMLQIFLLGSVGLSSTSLNKSLLLALGETKVQMLVMLGKALILLLLLPYFTHIYGIHGAIYAVLITVYVAIPVQYIYMVRKEILDIRKELRIIPVFVLTYSFVILDMF